MSIEFTIVILPKAGNELNQLTNDPSKKAQAKAVIKCLKQMGKDLKHQSLNTHKYDEFTGPNGEEIFESYAQNNTPGAYRIFWFYGPGRKVISILKICQHP